MLRVAFAGTPEFALPALNALFAAPHQLVGVLTQPDRPAGRGRGLRAGPVKRRALELGVALAQPAQLHSAAARATLLEWRPELLVVVAYGLILPRAVLDMPRLGCLNIHASLLPRWRGAAPIHRAILAGDTLTGVTIMQLDAGLDTGAILAQQSVPITTDMTTAALHEVLANAGAQLLLTVIAALEAGTAQPRAQPEAGVSYAAKLEKREGVIDWTQPAERIARQVRGCNPWPIAETSIHGQQLRIWQAAALPDLPVGTHLLASTASPAATAPLAAAAVPLPGTVLGLDAGRLLVACGEGLLAIERLQGAGRRVVSAADFAHGHALDRVQLG